MTTPVRGWSAKCVQHESTSSSCSSMFYCMVFDKVEKVIVAGMLIHVARFDNVRSQSVRQHGVHEDRDGPLHHDAAGDTSFKPVKVLIWLFRHMFLTAGFSLMRQRSSRDACTKMKKFALSIDDEEECLDDDHSDTSVPTSGFKIGESAQSVTHSPNDQARIAVLMSSTWGTWILFWSPAPRCRAGGPPT